MKIAYSWLRNYIKADITPQEASIYLTDCGLEVEGMEEVETIKGGLKGIVIGEVLTKVKHPDADKLNCTTVNVGGEEPLSIVCGAPNVEVGQKVVVSTVGAELFPIDGESFKIKKSKIRGEVSEGMICAEDEIGLGKGHDGIMVLDPNAIVGTPAAEYFNVESDWMIEIGLTPNRADAASHFGVARDLVAVLKRYDKTAELLKPSVDAFKVANTSRKINVTVEDQDACPRYSSVTISGVEVKDSPNWLKNHLLTIGAKPINNVVDVTNYVLHEMGQPLHAFDADKIVGDQVIVKQMPGETAFVTLDSVERKLSNKDLMICNAEGGMCIAGVFGGEQCGVKTATTNVFLESAYFNPVSVRKTAKRHGLNTDASFRYERGTDPNITIYALKRAALLIQELAGGEITSEIDDIYPNPIANFEFDFSIANCNRIIGQVIGDERIKQILTDLEIEIKAEKEGVLSLSVPPYRVDVQREIDVIEDVLRVFGYNHVEMPDFLKSSLSYAPKPDAEELQNSVSNLMTDNGFYEIWNNSLTAASWYKTDDRLGADVVEMLNPLSSDLSVMRQNLLFGGLDTLRYNINRKSDRLKMYEFGKTYFRTEGGKYKEIKRLSLLVTGMNQSENWQSKSANVNFYNLKNQVELIIQKLKLKGRLETEEIKNDQFAYGISYTLNKRPLVDFGAISSQLLKKFDVSQEVFYADFNWDSILKLVSIKATQYTPISKFPSVRRDLALLIDEAVKFEQIEQLAQKQERKLLKEVNLFDVYQGKNLAEGKKSYGVSFTFGDDDKTLTDVQIEKVMDKLIKSYQKELGAELR
jgi:phenylalanyl-tRNA synthetase beta chain